MRWGKPIVKLRLRRQQLLSVPRASRVEIVPVVVIASRLLAMSVRRHPALHPLMPLQLHDRQCRAALNLRTAPLLLWRRWALPVKMTRLASVVRALVGNVVTDVANR